MNHPLVLLHLPSRIVLRLGVILLAFGVSLTGNAQPAVDAQLYRRISIPNEFLTTEDNHTFGGDVRIGDMNGDGLCDFLVYRSSHSGPSGPAIGGFKPCFFGAFEMDGTVLWSVGGGGTHPVRPGAVAIHDLDGDGSAEVICFWHQPNRLAVQTRPNHKEQDGSVEPSYESADWQSLSDIVVQIRDGKTGKVIRQAAPVEITSRRCQSKPKPEQPRLSIGRRTANWVHQRILVANFRGSDRPRDFVIKLGDTHVAFDDRLNVLWSYTTEWVEYSKCPAYIPAVGDIDGDGRDDVNSGYFLLDHDGRPFWKRRLGDNMDSVAITAWDDGQVRAVCSGLGHIMDARGKVVLSLGKNEVPHGQEVRVANLIDDLRGPEMIIRHKGHSPATILVSSETNQIISRCQLNASPTNVGMEPVFWNGSAKAALLYNGGWLWDLKTMKGNPLPDLPPPNGGKVHRMGFYHAIPANLCGDDREEIVLWDPTATEIFIYAPKPLDQSAYRGYQAGPRQFNPRIMD
jgi:hypothetical protein